MCLLPAGHVLADIFSLACCDLFGIYSVGSVGGFLKSWLGVTLYLDLKVLLRNNECRCLVPPGRGCGPEYSATIKMLYLVTICQPVRNHAKKMTGLADSVFVVTCFSRYDSEEGALCLSLYTPIDTHRPKPRHSWEPEMEIETRKHDITVWSDVDCAIPNTLLVRTWHFHGIRTYFVIPFEYRDCRMVAHQCHKELIYSALRESRYDLRGSFVLPRFTMASDLVEAFMQMGRS